MAILITDDQIKQMTLTEYLKNFDNLTQDLNHWASYGITTAVQLGDYLDACVEKEIEDSFRYGED